MLKELILKEAEKLSDISIELDGIFEAVELSDEVKAKFSTVYEATVKAKAASLAESHITNLAKLAEEREEIIKEEALETATKELTETTAKFMDHLSKEWLEENKLAVSNGLKAELFESMFAGIKELVIDHNVILPEGSVDVVAELEEENQEQRLELQKIFDDKVALQEEVLSLKRGSVIKESTKDLTESQKEKVSSLIEGISFNESFENKLSSIVEMVVKSEKPQESTLDESINNTDTGLNYEPEVVTTPKTQDSFDMDRYTNAAKRLK